MARAGNKEKIQRAKALVTKRRRLKEIARQKLIDLSNEGYTRREVACKVGCSPTTVSNAVKRWCYRHTLSDKPRPGPNRKIPAVDLGLLKKAIMRHQVTPHCTIAACAQWLKDHRGLTVKRTTLWDALHRSPLQRYVMRRKPALSHINVEKRKKCAEVWAQFTPATLERMISSDEKMLDGRQHRGREVVYDKSGAPLHPGRIRLTVGSKLPCVNVCGAITPSGFLAYHIIEGNLTAEGYCDILTRTLLPAARKKFGRNAAWIFQQDNAAVHKAKVVKKMFQGKPWSNVTVLDWPPYSPDLSLIENAWTQLVRKVAERKAKGKVQVKTAIIEAIIQMNNEESKTRYFRNLFASFPKRAKETLAAGGYSVDY